MTDDPDSKKPGFGDLESPFLFVPHGAPEPAEWMRKHPGWVKFPATFVPRAPAAVRTIPGTNRPWPLDKRGQPWPRSRFGQPLRPLDEYPPGVRAPGEGYTGPIADPDKAVRNASVSGDVLVQAARYAADPDAPIRAYLSAKDVWENPWKYAGWPRPEVAPASVRVPPEAERNAAAVRAGMDRTHAERSGAPVPGSSHTERASRYKAEAVTISSLHPEENYQQAAINFNPKDVGLSPHADEVEQRLNDIAREVLIGTQGMFDGPNRRNAGNILHKLFADAVRAANIPGVRVEESYAPNGEVVRYGSDGSKRTDVILINPRTGQLEAIWDREIGSARLTVSRAQELVEYASGTAGKPDLAPRVPVREMHVNIVRVP